VRDNVVAKNEQITSV